MEHMEQLGQLAGKHPLSNLWHVKLLGEGRLLETEVARTLNQGLGGGGGSSGSLKGLSSEWENSGLPGAGAGLAGTLTS